MPAATISIAELQQQAQQSGPLRLVDVRTPAEFARLHAAGAHNIPLDQLDPEALAAGHKNSDGSIYVICHSGTRSASACQKLAEAGIEHTYSVEGGTAAWQRLGLPVVRGKGAISLERQVRIGAGLLVLIGCLLAWLVHPAFLLLSGFVGAGLVFAGITDICGMAILLGKMPWNRQRSCEQRQTPPTDN